MKHAVYLSLATMLAMSVPAPVHGELIEEYFNGYGTTDEGLTGKGSDSGGWDDGWTGFGVVDYHADEQLSYSSPNYSNVGNDSGSDDGLAGKGFGTVGSVQPREFTAGMTGTIWISVLGRHSNVSGQQIFWLDRKDTTDNFVSIRGEDAQMRYGGSNDTASTTVYGVDETYLYLVKIGMNVSGASDSLDFWLFDANGGTAGIPDVPSSEAGLGSAIYSRSGTDVFGLTFDGIGVSVELSGDQFDAIRISNNVDGFSDVVGVAVPEPSTGTLLGLVGMMVVGFARRRRRE